MTTPTVDHHAILAPVLAEFEVARAATRQRVLQGLAIIASVALLAIAAALWFKIVVLAIVSGVAALITALIWSSFPIAQFNSRFKHEVITRLVAQVNPTLTYQPTMGIEQPVFQASRLFHTDIDRYGKEDLVEGTIGATHVRFSEVHAEYKTETTDSDGDSKTTWHTIFRGIYVVADFNKYFQGHTIIMPGAGAGLAGAIGGVFERMGNAVNFGPLQPVALEDPEFEACFNVRSTDQVEARYILSPALMRRLIDFQATHGNTVRLAFLGNTLHIALPKDRNHFEAPSVWSSEPIGAAQLQSYTETLAIAQSIVDDLNLNLRIWSRV